MSCDIPLGFLPGLQLLLRKDVDLPLVFKLHTRAIGLLEIQKKICTQVGSWTSGEIPNGASHLANGSCSDPVCLET